jgi:hypothetical protein
MTVRNLLLLAGDGERITRGVRLGRTHRRRCVAMKPALVRMWNALVMLFTPE